MTTNIELDTGGTNAMTVYTTNVEEIQSKTLINIVPGTATANWSVGPKDTKVVDLLRVEKRFNVDGYIDIADRSKLRNILNAGGTFTMTYAGEAFTVNVEKFSLYERGDFQEDTNSPSDNPQQLEVKMSLIVGINV
jgi:hypothetical protein